MFKREDDALHKGLMKLLDEATFPLMAKEAQAFIVIYKWAQELPNRMKKPKEEDKKEEPIKAKKKGK